MKRINPEQRPVEHMPWRFPRTGNPDVEFVARLRKQYPPPYYNPKRGWHESPASMILNWQIEAQTESLRKWAGDHGLLTKGSRHDLMKRLYLHWRACKLEIGEPYIGYGKEYECVSLPSCACGMFYRRKEIGRNMKRFPRFPDRFPRTKRYPRLLRYPRIRISRYPRV